MPAAFHQVVTFILAANIAGFWLEDRRRAFFALGSGIEVLRVTDTLQNLVFLTAVLNDPSLQTRTQ